MRATPYHVGDKTLARALGGGDVGEDEVHVVCDDDAGERDDQDEERLDQKRSHGGILHVQAVALVQVEEHGADEGQYSKRHRGRDAAKHAAQKRRGQVRADGDNGPVGQLAASLEAAEVHGHRHERREDEAVCLHAALVHARDDERAVSEEDEA